MYGLFPALMETERFRADQSQRAADAEMRRQEMGMRQQDQVMRQRQMAMQEEQNKLQNQEMGLRMGRMKEEDTAVASLADLQRRDAESQQFNGTGLMRPVDDREMNNATGAVALARRDMAGLAGARKANRMLDVNDEAKRMAADPEFQDKVMDYISTKDMFPLKAVQGQRDPKTGQLKTPDTLVFDDGFKHTLKEGDHQRMAYGAALMKFGMNEEGLAQFAAVNKDLAALVDRANQRTISMSNFNSQAQDRVDRSQDRDEDRAVRKEQIAAAGAARVAAGEARNATKWQQDRLERGDRLGQEAAGYAQGLTTAKGLGPQGAEAARIYNSLLQGTNQRMAGLGLRPHGARDPVPPQVIMEETRKFMETPQGAKMSPAAAYETVESMLNGRGGDPVAKATEATRAELAKLRGGSGASGVVAPTADSPEMAYARRVQALNPEQFAVFQKMQQGQPTSPRERQLLKQAGIEF